MQTFKYSALSRDGTMVSGQIDAADEYAAAAEIRQSHPTILKIDPVNSGAQGVSALFKPKIKEKSLAIMCSQFSIILGSGLSVICAIELIAAQTADKALRQVLEEAAVEVASGFSLARSL